MLLRFVTSNFRSIASELEFNMFPYTKLRSHRHQIYHTAQVDVLKAAAIYGANGSGKSNWVRALNFLHGAVVENFIGKIKIDDLHFKLNPAYADKPISFEIEFKQADQYFSYGLQLLNQEIVEEWLCELNIKEEKDQMIFSRQQHADGRISLTVTDKYLTTEKDRLLIQVYAEEILDHKTTFIHQVREKAQYPEIMRAYRWFKEKLFVIYPYSRFNNLVSNITDNPTFRQFANEVLPRLDTGVSKVEVEQVPFDVFFGEEDEALKIRIKREFDNGAERYVLHLDRSQVVVVRAEDGSLVVNRIITRHDGATDPDCAFQLEEESDGTRRLFDLLPALELLTQKEAVFVIDEIGRSLHPSILKAFLRLFLSGNTRGQLIFTTHESNLLDLKLFRQDEIWFMEKDKKGVTQAYPLSEFKPRYDLDIRKGYLNGRFGAIPFLANLKDFQSQSMTSLDK